MIIFARTSIVAALFAVLGCTSEDVPGGAGGASTTSTGGESTTGGGGDCATATSEEPGVVVTDRGAVRGVLVGSSYAFKGVPYAAPPVGELRFKPPVEASCWSEVRDASEFGAVCRQYDEGFTGDEDCLTLNVWTSTPSRDASLPVLVFLHGGGNVEGSGAGDAIEGAWLGEHGGVVVVTLNYRLGALGFLAHPALSAESDNGISGNYGILDQIAALQWVQRNIAAFGGDPSRVLLFGESAGASDVGVHLVSPLSAGLFASAAMQSGRSGSWIVPLAEAEQAGASIAAAGGCADAACLRGLSADAALSAGAGYYATMFGPRGYKLYPNIDGYVLTAHPMEAMAAGTHNHMPVLIGANRDETAYFYLVGNAPEITTEEDYEAALSDAFGAANVAAILAHYPASAHSTPRAAFIAATSDANFKCDTRRVARALVPSQAEPVYRYFFQHGLSMGPSAWAGAFHSLELLFIFHTLDNFNYPASASDTALADAMSGYWTRLASGDPNGAGAPVWPTAERDALLVLDDTITTTSDSGDPCDFWDATWQN